MSRTIIAQTTDRTTLESNFLLDIQFTPQPGNTIPVRLCGHLDMIGNDGAICVVCHAWRDVTWE